MIRVCDIASAIEEFAPLSLQEGYDNAGLQVGQPDMQVSGILLCLDVTEDSVAEARKRGCNMIVSHHPLIFHGLKSLTGGNSTQRIVMEALRHNIAIYSAHTNLDKAREGVSYEMAHMLGMKEIVPIEVVDLEKGTGLGVVGTISPLPKLEFLRRLKETFDVRHLRYSAQSPHLVVRKVALCGGSGASLIPDAVALGVDCFISGDFKYHDFTVFGENVLLADIGHYESELCSRHIFSRIIRGVFPEAVICISDMESNPVKYL